MFLSKLRHCSDVYKFKSIVTTNRLVSIAVPSPPTAPLEVRNLNANTLTVEWGVPEMDGGAPLLGYNIAIRDEKKTMWMEVGRVGADVQKFNIKDLQARITRTVKHTRLWCRNNYF